MNAGKQALRRVKRMEAVIQKQTNLKSLTTAVSGATVASGATSIQSLVTMARGDTNYLREGDRITLKNMSWRITFNLDTNETNFSCVRFMIVYDRRPNGAQATAANVLTAGTIWGLMNLAEDYRGRFQVLHDQNWQLAPGGAEFAHEKGFKDLKNKRVLYDATIGDITDVQQGNLFVIFFAQGNASNVTANGNLRVRFVDDN